MKKFKAFTLAETMIVIVVLGIIATLTIPALVNKNKESVAKTKVRKAMAAYESALNKMIIENDLKSHETLTAWAGSAENNCANSTNYFKKVQGDGCIFKTSDGIWWNISDIERPLIAFNQDNLTTAKANNENDYSAFVLVGRFGTDGSLRVDDLAYETANDTANSKAQVEKLYTLLGLKSTNAGDGISCNESSPFCLCQKAGEDTCEIDNKIYKKIVIDAVDGVASWGIELLAESGEIWITDISSVLNETDAKSNENCAESRDQSFCRSHGDYWALAKRSCDINSHLATAGEMKALYNAGQLDADSTYWMTVEDAVMGPQATYYFSTNTGNVSFDSFTRSRKAVCVGNR